MLTSDSLRIVLVLVAVQGVSCDERVVHDSNTDLAKPNTMTSELPPPERVHMIGYDGLDPAIRARDFARVTENLGDPRWPTREVFHAGSLEQFPVSAGKLRSTIEPVPIYVIVDPAEIDAHWKLLVKTKEYSTPLNPYPSFDGTSDSVATVYIDPTTFTDTDFFYPPWPTWADGCLNKSKSSPYPNLMDTRWSAMTTMLFALSREDLSSHLESRGVSSQGEFVTLSISSTVWRVIVWDRYGIGDTVCPRGELAFPLWESTGLLRVANDDPWSSERTGPMSTHVESPEFEWKVKGRSAFVLVKPLQIPISSTPKREYVALPESLGRQSIPIVSIYKSKTWKPLAEDYEFRIGPPTTTDGLRAVCVFMTCSDDQLRKVGAAMGSASRVSVDGSPKSD